MTVKREAGVSIQPDRDLVPDQLHQLAFDGGEHIGKLVAAFQDLPGFGDEGPHALPAPQGGAFFDAIFGAFGGAAKGRENGGVTVEVHRIIAPMPGRDHAAVKVEDAHEFGTLETGLLRNRSISERQGRYSPHQAPVRLPLRRGASSSTAASSRSSSNAFNRSEEHTSELQSLMRISYAVFCLQNKTNAIIDKTIQNNRRRTV